MRKITGQFVALLCVIMVGTAMAAGPEPIAAEDVEFTKFDFDLTLVDYNDDFPGLPKVGGGKKLKYPMFLLEYEWQLDEKAKKKKYKDSEAANGYYYLDDLEFEWRVVLAEPTSGKSVRSSGKTFNIEESKSLRMTKSVRYSNVSDNGKHYATVFIEPRLVERLFSRFRPDNVFLELVIRVGGEDAVRLNAHGEKFEFFHPQRDREKDEDKLLKYKPKRRTTEPNFFLSRKVQEVNGVLLAKNQTPWALSQQNIFETIIVEPAKK